MEGLTRLPDFEAKMEYGNMWHCCEENYLKNPETWNQELVKYVKQLALLYPLHQEKITHWYQICVIQFRVYIDHWAELTKGFKPIEQEKVFEYNYKLPTGRFVKLLGKRDAVNEDEDLVLWLQENKSKGGVDEAQISRQLKLDLQTMIYLTVMKGQYFNRKIGGVLYNVIRRPLASGQPGCIKQKKNETRNEFLLRVKHLIEESPKEYFHRWRVDISEKDTLSFQERVLIPILEGLLDWWEWVKFCKQKGKPYWSAIHWQHPYGVWNPINEGYSHDLDYNLETGNQVGLTRVNNLFPELGDRSAASK
jgi:hypothetical protein